MPAKPTPILSSVVALDEAAASAHEFKVALDKAAAARDAAQAEFDVAQQKVRDLHAQLLAQLSDLVPPAPSNFHP